MDGLSSACFIVRTALPLLIVALGPCASAQPRGAASPVALALDANRDGEVDAGEIRDAPKALARLDRNGDGQITRDELRGNLAPAQKPAPPATAPKGTPNILVLIADDLGWNGVGFHNPKMPTPNLDRLAREGMELGRFYTHPVCSPTRAAFLTGKLPLRHGITEALGPRHEGIPSGVATLAEILRGAGYQTALAGKWHLGKGRPPMACGFEHFHGFLGPQIDYFKHTNPRGEPDWQHDGKPIEESGYSTDLIADETIRRIQTRDPVKPFFIVTAFNAPHVPLSAPEELMKKHGNDVYTAAIDAMDKATGRILTAIEQAGLRDDTLVIFFSDNGAGPRFQTSAPFSGGKDDIREGGIRTPCVIRWPGKITAAGTCPQPVAAQDLLPTLCAAAGVALPSGARFDGSNQWTALVSGKAMPREPILIATGEWALIDGDWKLIELNNGRRSLFHLTEDMAEIRDLSTTQADRFQQLGARLDAMKQSLPAAPTRRNSKPSIRKP